MSLEPFDESRDVPSAVHLLASSVPNDATDADHRNGGSGSNKAICGGSIDRKSVLSRPSGAGDISNAGISSSPICAPNRSALQDVSNGNGVSNTNLAQAPSYRIMMVGSRVHSTKHFTEWLNSDQPNCHVRSPSKHYSSYSRMTPDRRFMCASEGNRFICDDAL